MITVNGTTPEICKPRVVTHLPVFPIQLFPHYTFYTVLHGLLTTSREPYTEYFVPLHLFHNEYCFAKKKRPSNFVLW